MRIATSALLVLAAALPYSSAPAAAPADDEVVVETDVVYGKGADQDLKLDLAQPKVKEGAAAKRAAIVVIHGGGWRAGNRGGRLTDLIKEFAKRGYVAASISYRFCPQHPFPAQIEDAKCAVRFLRSRADHYHIDPDRVGAVGFSAGAHLAMLLGVMGKEDGLEGSGGTPDQKSQVQAVVAYFGPTDLVMPDIPDASKPLLKDFLGGVPSEKADLAAKASPINYVSAGDAPILIFQGTKDPLVPHTQATRMADAMTKAGVAGRIELLVGRGHGFQGADQARTQEEMWRFFGEVLKAPAAATKP